MQAAILAEHSKRANAAARVRRALQMKKSIHLRSVLLLSLSSAVFPSCKSQANGSSAAPSGAAMPAAHKPSEAGPVALPTGFDVTISVPLTATDFEMMGTAIVYMTDNPPLAEARDAFVKRSNGQTTQTEKLPDGEVWRNEARGEVYRTLGDRTITCASNKAEAIERAIAMCKAIVRIDQQLRVPVALQNIPQDIRIADDYVTVSRANANDAATVEAETANLKGLTLLAQPKVSTGFALAYQAYNGNNAQNGLETRVVTRQQIRNLDIMCVAWPTTAAAASTHLAHCTSLR